MGRADLLFPECKAFAECSTQSEPVTRDRIKGAMTSALDRPARAGARKPSAPARPRPEAPDRAAFDAWLRTELTRLYDATLQEPIPEGLLRILRDKPLPE